MGARMWRRSSPAQPSRPVRKNERENTKGGFIAYVYQTGIEEQILVRHVSTICYRVFHNFCVIAVLAVQIVRL